eukprot:4451729-Pyramimonas_sp.AAC.1
MPCTYGAILDLWRFREDELTGFGNLSDVLEDMQRQFQVQCWSRAAVHCCGAGMEGGIDNHSYWKFTHTLQRSGDAASPQMT